MSHDFVRVNMWLKPVSATGLGMHTDTKNSNVFIIVICKYLHKFARCRLGCFITYIYLSNDSADGDPINTVLTLKALKYVCISHGNQRIFFNSKSSSKSWLYLSAALKYCVMGVRSLYIFVLFQYGDRL